MKQRVLIIDDEPNIRRMARLALEASGYEVGEAASGQEGLDAYAGDPSWNVVLLDQRMPGLDGLQTLKRLKERHARSQVIMITAYASIELAVDAMKLGANDFVRKPMTPEILRGAVAAVIAKASRRLKRPTAAPDIAEVQPAIETITLNGFEIIRPTAAEAKTTQTDERLFTVLTPKGKRWQTNIKISPEVIDYVGRLARRRLPAESSFWTSVAERLLSDYLWAEGRLPPNGKLTLKEIDREQLLTAERWQE